MSTTYTWTVNSIECTANNDIETDCDEITSALWTLTGNNGTISSSITSRSPLLIDMEPTGEESNNAPFLALTEANVISAIQSTLGTNQIKQLEAQIDTNLVNLSVNTITPTLPWV